jgi:iron complex outermembrane receptor protein
MLLKRLSYNVVWCALACAALAQPARAQQALLDAPAVKALPATEPGAASASPSAAGEEKTSGGGGGLSTDMKLDDLVKQDVVVPAMTQVVTTVDRQESTVGHSPAAVFVITREMIRRSGVRAIPEALRMAPGITVAKITSSTWAISARGFNGRFGNKLLVQIDGRVVYTPTFGGVFWDIQDVVLEDVERIEVIRGPGTTAWGSNAVNGVINIITKNTAQTQGAYVNSGGGNYEQDYNTVRYGGRISDTTTYSVWGKQFDRNRNWSGPDFIPDGWRQQRIGFRTDYAPSKDDSVTIIGDLYNGYDGERLDNTIPTPPFSVEQDDMIHVSGGDIQFRWARNLDEDTGWQFQTYYLGRVRHQPAWAENRYMWDVDFQYRWSPAEYHQFIAGANYRHNQDFERGGFSFELIPNDFVTQWASVFAQDEMTLIEDYMYFTLGCRLEYNTFGKFQPEPTARLLIQPSNRESVWMAVSRAVRNPTRFDTGIQLRTQGPLPGLFYQFEGDPAFRPEAVMSYEIGYRAQPVDSFSWDIAGYMNDYRSLRGFDAPGPITPIGGGLFVIPVELANNVSAVTGGAEVTATWQLRKDWQLFGSYSLFEANASGPASAEFFIAQYNGSTAHNNLYLRSSWDLTDEWQFDMIGRYMDSVDIVDTAFVPSYIEMDLRLAYRPNDNFEVYLVGQNLLQGHHLEYVDFELGMQETEVRRGVYAGVMWTH